MIGDSWIDDAKQATVPDVAGELELEYHRRSFGPCPGCGADRRGSGDRRGPIGPTGDGHGWRCHRCQVGGSVLDLVGQVLGVEPCSAEVRSWFATRGWCSSPNDDVSIPPIRRRPAPPPQPPPERPPFDEVVDLWERCGRVGDDDEVVAWLRSRALDIGLIEDRGLARVLDDTRLPQWAAHWPWQGCGLVLPLYDASGVLASMQGRRVVDGDGPKSSAARGVARIGLLADGTGRAMLEHGGRPPWWTGDLVIIAEGEPDFLTWSTWVGESDSAPAVIGLPGGGSWSSDYAARIPSGIGVAVRMHDDDAGRRYSGAIVRDLLGRCDLRIAGTAA